MYICTYKRNGFLINLLLSMLQKINDFMAQVEAKNPNEPEFIQAVREFAETVIPFIAAQKNMTGKTCF